MAYQVPKLNRLERMIFAALNQTGPQSIEQLARAVQVASPNYIQTSLRVLRFAGVVIQEDCGDQPIYSAAPDIEVQKTHRACQPVPPVDQQAVLTGLATEALESLAAKSPDRLVSWRTLYKSRNWTRVFGVDAVNATLNHLLDTGKVSVTRTTQAGKLIGKVLVH